MEKHSCVAQQGSSFQRTEAQPVWSTSSLNGQMGGQQSSCACPDAVLKIKLNTIKKI